MFRRKAPLQLDLRASRGTPSRTGPPPPEETGVRAVAATNSVLASPDVNADSAFSQPRHVSRPLGAVPTTLADPGRQPARPSVLRDVRRRSQRVLLQVGVTLELELDGRTVALNVRTINVSIEGALVLSSVSIPSGMRIVLEYLRTHQKQACRVMRAPREAGGMFEVPLEFEGAAPNFWEIAFPPPNWKAADG